VQGRLENLLGALALSLADQVRERAEAVAGAGPSGPAALLAIYRRPHQPIEALRRAIGLSHSATVRLVDRLEADGLVSRRPAADGREVSLALTPKGRRRVLRIEQERRSVLTRSLAGLSAAERRGLEALVARLLRNQAIMRDDPTPICRLCELAVCPLRTCPVPGGR
jgi:MarR family transcriptional regulator, negative regulator of the multidrug operon emrRAB